MSATVAVVGGGVGGLSAALRLARRGIRVRLFEARDDVGGLASDVVSSGVRFDGGPYVLLDRPGLERAFEALGLETSALRLRRVEDVYDVCTEGGRVTFHADLERTAEGFERAFPGSGSRYRDFVAWGQAAHRRLRHVLFVSRPGPLDLLRHGAWRDTGLVLRSLGSVLASTGLPRPILDAIAIWTHVAGQPLGRAPGFMALLPGLIHGEGAFYPTDGMGSIPRALAAAATAAGVEIACRTRVRSIACRRGRVAAVECEEGAFDCDAVVSNVGLATYLKLLPGPKPEPGVRRRLASLPLQSPGGCAYLLARGNFPPPYLRFMMPTDGGRCRLFLPVPGSERDGWRAARLIAPIDHARAQALGEAGQREWLDGLLAEGWWREGLDDVQVLERRTPATWGRQFALWHDAMNPVMTSTLARHGRLAHRSPWVRGLYLAGSATHPGQWVSFCAVSGVLAADELARDLGLAR